MNKKIFFKSLFFVILIQKFSSVEAQLKSLQISYIEDFTFSQTKDTFNIITNNQYCLYSNVVNPQKKGNITEDDIDKLSFSVTIEIEKYILRFIDEPVIYSKEYFFDKKPIWVNDTLNIVWELIDETKIIQGYTCKKAVCNFKGRKYIAWFTPDIPVNAGPWKLSGLPGLIVEVKDIDKKVHFLMIAIKEVNAPTLDKTDYKMLKLVKWTDYKKIWNSKYENFNKFLSNSIQKEGATISVNTQIELLEKSLLANEK
jgi:GLPGLI family protein